VSAFRPALPFSDALVVACLQIGTFFVGAGLQPGLIRALPDCRSQVSIVPNRRPPHKNVIPTGASAPFADAQWRDLSALHASPNPPIPLVAAGLQPGPIRARFQPGRTRAHPTKWSSRPERRRLSPTRSGGTSLLSTPPNPPIPLVAAGLQPGLVSARLQPCHACPHPTKMSSPTFYRSARIRCRR
jgi:hypothetical protein